ncbi:MAG: hypothetical protein R2731_08400 [Nocardioides sp.]
MVADLSPRRRRRPERRPQQRQQPKKQSREQRKKNKPGAPGEGAGGAPEKDQSGS